MEELFADYLDEGWLRDRYPEAHDSWQSALDLCTLDPVRNATRIGHDCREALLFFAEAVQQSQGQVAVAGSGTVAKLKAILSTSETTSATAAHCKALIAFWGTVSDLAQRQEHGATKEGERLRGDDARRLVFHTMLVMHEVDRMLRAGSGPRADR